MKKERLTKRIISVMMAVLMLATVSAIAYASEGCEHTWNYTAMKNRMYAYCTEEGCGYSSESNPVEMIISAADEHFTGYKYSSVNLNTAEWTEAGLEIPTVVYSGRGNTNYATTTVAPSSVGTYSASITVDGKTASAEFEILKYAALKTPSGIATVWASAGNNGELLGLDTTMEYRIAGGEWKEITSAAVSNLVSGEYEIRYCETEIYEPSESVKVFIAGEVKNVDATIGIIEPIANSRYTTSEFELECGFEGEIPAGCRISWKTDSSDVALSTSNNGKKCMVTVDGSSLRTVNVTVSLVDLNGNVVKNIAGEEITATNKITLTNNFIETIIRIFRIFSFLNPNSFMRIK